MTSNPTAPFRPLPQPWVSDLVTPCQLGQAMALALPSHDAHGSGEDLEDDDGAGSVLSLAIRRRGGSGLLAPVCSTSASAKRPRDGKDKKLTEAMKWNKEKTQITINASKIQK